MAYSSTMIVACANQINPASTETLDLSFIVINLGASNTVTSTNIYSYDHVNDIFSCAGIYTDGATTYAYWNEI